MLCFVCQKAARFKFNWPWNPNALAVCSAHVDEVKKRARGNACRVPELEPLPELELEEPLPRPPLLPSSSSSVGATNDHVPTAPGTPKALAQHEPEPLAEGTLAVVTIGKGPAGTVFALRRPGQHGAGGPIAELVVTLVALGLVPSAEAPPSTERPPRPAGDAGSSFSNPQQVTPPAAASALAGAVSGPGRGSQRAPVNPPMSGMGVNPVARGPFRTQQRAPVPLGAVGSVATAPGGQPPTPPPVAPPGAAPVAAEAPPAEASNEPHP